MRALYTAPTTFDLFEPDTIPNNLATEYSIIRCSELPVDIERKAIQEAVLRAGWIQGMDKEEIEEVLDIMENNLSAS